MIPAIRPLPSRIVVATTLLSLCAGLVGGSSVAATAGEYNPVLDIGDPAPSWNDLPGTDGKLHSLNDLKDKSAVVVVFTCNSCPYANDYEDRMIAFAERHAGPNGSVGMVAINVNRVPEDSLEQMTARAKQKGYRFPYLFDDSQEIAKAYGATFTPEFFVLNKQRQVVYMGAMDDSTDPDKVAHNYVQDAVVAAAADMLPEVRETVAIGCLIRFVRTRRSRKKE